MLINLEFAKTMINAINSKFRRVQSDVDAIKSDAPNWNEPNSESHAYIKNKPCYDYIEPSVVIWESDSAEVSSRFSLILVDLVDGWLIEGGKYRLTVDGVETTYTCAADADGRGLYIGGGYSDANNGGIFQSHTNTILHAWSRHLWDYGQKVRLEGPLRRYKKLDTSLYDSVISVNGKTGEVQITPEDIGAACADSKIINAGQLYILRAIYGTYKGKPCGTLYLGGERWLSKVTISTGEEAFGFGPYATILTGIKTPINNDDAANKDYVDATVAAARESIKLRSSTEGSTKLFEITVNDDGIISATEVVK